MKTQARHQNVVNLKKQNEYLIEDLLQMTDPYVQSRLHKFKKTIKRDNGPNFLQRMKEDLRNRARIS